MSPQARRYLWIAWTAVYLGGAIAGVYVTLTWTFDPRTHDHYGFYRWNQWLIVYLAVGYFVNKFLRKALVDDEDADAEAGADEHSPSSSGA